MHDHRTPSLLFAVVLFAANLDARPAGIQEDFSSIDEHALAASSQVERDIPILAEYLTRPAKGDTQKARAIFRWMTDRISYDLEEMANPHASAQTPAQVLKSRKGVCEGFSQLFAAIASAAGMEAIVIKGLVKRMDYEPVDKKAEADHAWVGIRVNGEWKLIDPTWGAGGFVDGKIKKEFDPFYFMPAPQSLILTHFPDEDRWQLLNVPVTREEFARAAPARPDLLEGVVLRYDPLAVIETNEKLILAYDVPQGRIVRLWVEQLGPPSVDDALPIIRRIEAEGSLKFEFKFLHPGEYGVTLLIGLDDPVHAVILRGAMQHVVRVRFGTDP